MKAFKKLTISTMVLSGFAILANASYNTVLMSDTAFMSASSEIKFAKRLDEIEGKVVVGRMAASTVWQTIEPATEKVVKQKIEKKVAEVKQEQASELAQEIDTPAPAIKGDLELSLTNVFYKKALKEGSFSGSARTVDGIVEEIYVNLPEGEVIEINTREQMMGNVFQYEDSETREMKSALFYEVKPGTYMVTLTNDSKYAGVRMEFNTGDAAIAYDEEYYQDTRGWGTNNQNQEEQLADEADYGNTYPEEQETQPEYQDNAAQEGSFSFNFQAS